MRRSFARAIRRLRAEHRVIFVQHDAVFYLMPLVLLALCWPSRAGEQIRVGRIETMPNLPQMWYALLPTMLAFCLDDRYPGHGRLDEYVRRSADTVAELGAALEDGNWYTGYDFYGHKPVSNGKWTEGDAVAAVAWIQYMAYARFKDDKYIRSARNLLVPVCISCSHIAYGSVRMEPVFMILGQSAATAAVLAIDDGVSVQQLDYARLRARLLADRQRLDGFAKNQHP